MLAFEQQSLNLAIEGLSGPGFIGGSAPIDPNPTSPDGRTKVLGVNRPMRVILFDGQTRKPLREIISSSDGSWFIGGLKLNHRFAVEFVNDQYVDEDDVLFNSFVQDHIYAVEPE